MPTGQPQGERIIWDDANEKHLLLCILAEANPQKLDWAKIAERFGKQLTSGAARLIANIYFDHRILVNEQCPQPEVRQDQDARQGPV